MDALNRPRIKLTGGPHGIPRAVVQEVQRSRLLAATAEVIADEGYLETTVHKILKEAGISRRTFYEIFKDKEECFLAVYRETSDHMLDVVHAACRESDGSPERRVEDSLRATLEFIEQNPKLSRACIVEVMGAGPRARRQRTQLMDRLTMMVADALQARCATRAEALLRGRVLVGGVHELVYDSLARRKTHKLSDLASEVVASHLRPPSGIESPQAAGPEVARRHVATAPLGEPEPVHGG
jgi:AcrR family transcriptional regulator